MVTKKVDYAKKKKKGTFMAHKTFCSHTNLGAAACKETAIRMNKPSSAHGH